MKKKKSRKARNVRNLEFSAIIKTDPKRIREKIIFAETGKGRKDRPRYNTIDLDLF